MHIKISEGLDIPIRGQASSAIETLSPSSKIGIDFTPFKELKLKLLVKEGDTVSIGQPLAEDKIHPERKITSSASGTISQIQRGLKRSLETIIIDRHAKEDKVQLPPLSLSQATSLEIVERLLALGVFNCIQKRPFATLATPDQLPEAIFIKALESAPFLPAAEMQLMDAEELFSAGLKALSILAQAQKIQIHFVCKADKLHLFETLAKDIPSLQIHTAEGPHPISSPSVHIDRIHPIHESHQVLWCLDTNAVIKVGSAVFKGELYTNKVIALAGEGIKEGQRIFARVREGSQVSQLLEGRLGDGSIRLISGDPLMGRQVTLDQFLGFQHLAISALYENQEREPFHFFRAGSHKFSFHRAYLSGHKAPESHHYSFTTNQHGEERAFIDGAPYQKVMPIDVPVMHLVKAVLAENYELAQEMGLLEIAPEDFALPTFICPSKVEMVSIIEEGLQRFVKEQG